MWHLNQILTLSVEWMSWVEDTTGEISQWPAVMNEGESAESIGDDHFHDQNHNPMPFVAMKS
jgi:hypothetical protein